MVLTRSSLIEYLLAFLGGAAILVLPVALDPDHARYPAAFVPVVRDAVEGIQLYSLGLLVVFGAALGIYAKSSANLLAMFSVSIFPLWSIIDIASGGDGHNLLPFEWAFYAIYTLFPLIGIISARFTRRRLAAST
jgi:hypothetical protein